MKVLRIHYLQHVDFEGLGFIETWAKQHKHKLTCTKFYEEFTLPNLSEFDWLIIMGGPMGVYESNKYPWINAEIEFIEKTIRANKTIIGICLGAQLLATALGAAVYHNQKKEIGWLPLSKTNEGKKHQLLNDLPQEFTTFHWHGDTFDLPKNTIHLLQTEICKNQAFLYNAKVLGLQFHLETTPKTLADMIEHGRQELNQDEFIQSEKEILDQIELYKISNQFLASILSKMVELA